MEAISQVLKEFLQFVRYRTVETIIFICIIIFTPIINNYFLNAVSTTLQASYFGWQVSGLTVLYLLVSFLLLNALNYFIMQPYRDKKESEARQEIAARISR